MFSTFPSTPRGRSRFSKALPTAPDALTPPSTTMTTATAAQSPLPPLPRDAVMPPKVIPRRPVGGQAAIKPPSIRSLSSVYSDSPGLSRSLSESSSEGTKDSFSPVDSEGDSLPPAPPDKENEPVVERTNILESPSSLTSSPPRPELWRRRSIRSEKNIVVSELRLPNSNGSTASPPRRQEQFGDRPQLPRSITGRKPVPVRPAPPQPEFMGNKLAKLGDKLEDRLKKRRNSPTKSSSQSSPQQFPPPQRLPTPEYVKADKQQPATPQVLSPTSPFTPPDGVAPVLPPKAEARKLQAAQSSLAGSETPNLLSNHSRESSETLTIISEPQVTRSPQPQKAFAARILTPQPSPDKTSPTSFDLGSPAAHTTYFPTVQSPAARGTIFPGPPLDLSHFECYHSHKYMRGSSNTVCPTGCMICKRKDTEKRWRCTWCCLSACGPCMQVLTTTPGKDLRLCLERIEKRR